ncbi:MAG TPA: thioredoxin-like domain-containing protein [Opitutaceae bacterium]|nr:thioredoxin-like domain-containing protein [Opitutaceae bacterium]
MGFPIANPFGNLLTLCMRWSDVGRLWILVLWLVCPALLKAETWKLRDATAFEGTVTGIYGSRALFDVKGESRWIEVSQLEDESLLQLANFQDKLASSPPAWSQPVGKVAKNLKGRLHVLRDKKFVNFDPGTRSEPRFYLIYFGAHWCGPCRRFSPQLLTSYQALKEKYGDDVELIFVSSDQDSTEQRKYAVEVGMPWPIVRYSALGSVPTLERWQARGIPNLVALTANGDLLFHSYRGEEYLGPQDALTRFTSFLETVYDENSAERRQAFHRLAVLRHIQAAARTPTGPQPYLIQFGQSEFNGLSVTAISVKLTIDAQGHVSQSDIETTLPAVHRASLLRSTESWLFLPAVQAGRPVPITVIFPLKIAR